MTNADARKAQSMRQLWRITGLGLFALAGAVMGILANFVGGAAAVVLSCLALVILTVALVLMFRLGRQIRRDKANT